MRWGGGVGGEGEEEQETRKKRDYKAYSATCGCHLSSAMYSSGISVAYTDETKALDGRSHEHILIETHLNRVNATVKRKVHFHPINITGRTFKWQMT